MGRCIRRVVISKCGKKYRLDKDYNSLTLKNIIETYKSIRIAKVFLFQDGR